MSVSLPNVIDGDEAEPVAAFIGPVIAAWPSRGREFVISEATSVKFALTDELVALVPELKEFGTLMEPEPLRGIFRSPIG